MSNMQGRSPGRGRLTAVPLAVAYIAVPLGMAAAGYVGGSDKVSPTAPWLLLAALGALIAMYRPAPDSVRHKGFFFKATLFVLLLAGAFVYAADIVAGLMPYFPYLQEFSPLVFLLFSGLWAATCGLPDRGDFQRYGGLLGLFCIVDTVAEAVMYNAVPTVRWIGNADVLAGLLLVALCASLKPGDNDGGHPEPDQGNRWWRVLIMLGLVSCFSRTGLFAAAWVTVCFGRGLFRYRAAYGLLCALLIGATFFLPTTQSDAVRYTDYWLWVEVIRMAGENANILLTGFPVDQPLPISFPVSMGAIWEAATGQSSTLGVFFPQVPSFWLRLLFGWGLGVPVVLLIINFVLLFRHLTRMGAGLTAALFAQGMTTPLLFDPAMAMVIYLGFFVALSSPATRPNTRHEDSEPTPREPSSANPAEEWDMRPL